MLTPLAPGVSYLDLEFRGRPRIIATVVIAGPGGIALIDPGPASTLPALERALQAGGHALDEIGEILLTHIHLDHGGVTGTLLARFPRIRVFVHERGAPHLIDPSKLLASAGRLYGDDMDVLWGEVRPVPATALAVLQGGERVHAAGRALDVVYSPGHASHHVSFMSADLGIGFIGDTGGVRLTRDGYTMPPTPPPDIDVEAWIDSLRRLARWGSDTVFLTHFGPASPGHAHLLAFQENLEAAAALAERSLAREGSDEDRAHWFADEMRTVLLRKGTEEDVRAYQIAGRLDLSWRGLARYWRKRVGT
jgi:glyoxylase-like metal-dependent hydrolase (beta-lactamase superfamily II)